MVAVFLMKIQMLNFDHLIINPLRAKPTKWSNTLKQFVGKSQEIVLSVFDHFVGLALKGLRKEM